METTTEDTKRAENQAKAQFDSIVELVERLDKAEENDDYEESDKAREAIQEDALSVQVRSGWSQPGQMEAEEYEVLLCWGGPACRITGELNEYNEPETANLQYQDWFTGWKNYDCDEETLLKYVRQFYFGV